jgi:uncharacterized protein
MILVDTSYLVALALPRDQLHARAFAWSQTIRTRLVVTEYVLWECVNFFSDQMNRARAETVVSHISDHAQYELIPATRGLFLRGYELHRNRPDKSWSLTDCISFLVMSQRRMQSALTYDLHFEQAGFEALLRRDTAH